MKANQIVCLLCIASIVLPGVVLAEDASARTALRAQSSASALAKNSLRVYQRKPGPGRDAALQQLLLDLVPGNAVGPDAAIDVSAIESTSNDENWTVVKGPGWFLNVRGEGDKVGFINNDAINQKQSQRVPRSKAPRIARLEARARAFIAKSLANVVRLGPNEQLVAWGSRHAFAGEMEQGRTMTEGVVATVLQFRRMLDGFVVLGPGSTVSVTFAADGTIVGFDADWSSFADTGTTRQTVAIDVVNRRIADARAATGRANPPHALVSERSLECGYYDSGADQRDALLVPACLSNYGLTDTRTHDRQMFLDVISADPQGAPVRSAPKDGVAPPTGP